MNMETLGFREFLGVLHRHGVRVWEDNGALRVSASAMTDELKAELRARKPVLLAFLRGESIDTLHATTLGSQTSSDSQQWFFRPRPVEKARIKLFCVPYACGAGSMFGAWPNALPSDVEVFGIQFPGRPPRGREAPLTDLKETLEVLGRAVRDEISGHYALYGHSMGALIAFELARWLRRSGAPEPVHLFLAAHHGIGPSTPPLCLSDLPDGEFDVAWRALGGTPDQVMHDSELSKYYRPLLRADMAIRESHVFVEAPPLQCGVSAFGGSDDPQVSLEQLQAWRALCSGSFRVMQFPGNHFFLETAAPALLAAIRDDLGRSSQSRGVEGARC